MKTGTETLKAGATVDYLAKFGERQSHRTRMAQAHCIAGLGHLGPNEKEKAKENFTQALDLSPEHLWARTNLSALN